MVFLGVKGIIPELKAVLHFMGLLEVLKASLFRLCRDEFCLMQETRDIKKKKAIG